MQIRCRHLSPFSCLFHFYHLIAAARTEEKGSQCTRSRDEHLQVPGSPLLDVPTPEAPHIIRRYEEVIAHDWTQTHMHLELQHPTLRTQHGHKHFHLSYQPPQGHADLDPLYLRYGKALGTKKIILVLSLLR